MNFMRQRLLNIKQQTWVSEIQGILEKKRKKTRKLRTFKTFKLTHDYEHYLTSVRNIHHRVAITKLRRYVKPYQRAKNLTLIREQIICSLCKTGVEDEEHFLMNCIAYGDPRRELFNTLKEATKLYLDSDSKTSAFATLISMKQGEKTQKLWLNTYIIACTEEKYNLV